MSTQSPFTPPDHDAQRGHRPPNIRPSSHATSHPAVPAKSNKAARRVGPRILTAKQRVLTVKHELGHAIGKGEAQDRIRGLKKEVFHAENEVIEARIERRNMRMARLQAEKDRLVEEISVSERERQLVAASQEDCTVSYTCENPRHRTSSHETRVPTPEDPSHCPAPQPISETIPTFTEKCIITTGTLTTAISSHCTPSEHDNALKQSTFAFFGRDEQPPRFQISTPSRIRADYNVPPHDSTLSVSALEWKQPVLAPSNDPLVHQPCNGSSGTPSCETGAPRGIFHDHTVATVGENNTATPGTVISTAAGHCTHREHDNTSDESTLASFGHDFNEQPRHSLVLSQAVHHPVATPTSVDSKSSGVLTLESQPSVPAPFFVHV
ncbi:hypothetical protein V5O48_019227, partial [Marasmius crinis-equi]